MVLDSPDWTNIGFPFIILTVNLFRHPTLMSTDYMHFSMIHCKKRQTSESQCVEILKLSKRYRKVEGWPTVADRVFKTLSKPKMIAEIGFLNVETKRFHNVSTKLYCYLCYLSINCSNFL